MRVRAFFIDISRANNKQLNKVRIQNFRGFGMVMLIRWLLKRQLRKVNHDTNAYIQSGLERSAIGCFRLARMHTLERLRERRDILCTMLRLVDKI